MKGKDTVFTRHDLDLLLSSFIRNLSTTPLLYFTNTSPVPVTGPSTPILQLILHWLHPMSVSPYRAIRHTSTYIAMRLLISISSVEAEVAKDLGAANRLVETEVKRQAKLSRVTDAQKKKNDASLKGLKGKVAEIGERKAVLEMYLKETFDA